MELFKLRELLRYIMDQRAEVKNIYVVDDCNVLVLVEDGRAFKVSDRKEVRVFDPKYKPGE